MRVEEIVGQRIREHREASRITQERFGELLGVLLSKPWPRQTVSNAEQGKRQFTPTEVVACSQVLGVSVERLFSVPPEASDIAMPSGYRIARDKVMRPVGQGTVNRTAVLERLHATLSELQDVRLGLISAEATLSRTGKGLDEGMRRLLDDVRALDELLSQQDEPGAEEGRGDG